MEQFQKDQELLREIKSDEQKVIAVKLMVAAEMVEAQKCEEALKMLQEQKERYWARMTKRKLDLEAVRDRQIEVGEEASRVDISMDTTEMDYECHGAGTTPGCPPIC